MKQFILLTTLVLSIPGCATAASRSLSTKPKLTTMGTPSACGVKSDIVNQITSAFPNRISTDGGYDENGDGRVDTIESVTTWDFFQMTRVLNQGVEFKQYHWTNIDTCFKFKMIGENYYEDKTKPIVWRTCRTFTYNVMDHLGNPLGSTSGHACKNFGTHQWKIL